MSTNSSFFADQRPVERDPRLAPPGSNLASGTATTGVNEELEPGAQYRPTRESQAQPFGGVESPQQIAVPQLKEGATLSSLTDVLGHEAGKTVQRVEEGFGPRMVILHHFVTGPGIKPGAPRPAFGRGRVVWGSQLIGDEHMKKALEGDPQAIAMLRRYVTGPNPAAREARREEADFTQVTFVEGERALGAALQNTQAYTAAVESENERMRRILEALNVDPNMSPEEAARMASQPSSSVVPPGEPGSGIEGGGTPTPPPITPPVTPPVVPPVVPPVNPQGQGGQGGQGGGPNTQF